MNVKEMFHKFSAILSEDAIVELAKEYGVEDKRKRKLAVVPFFWLMVLSAIFDAIFTPQVIYELYSKRWTIDIFFNDIKHILKLSHIFSKNKNGIMAEIYSALIFYLLVRIMTAIAAEKSDKKITDFSFKKSVEIFSAFFLTQLSELIRGTKVNFIVFF